MCSERCLFTKINISSWFEGRAGQQKTPELPVFALLSFPTVALLNCCFQHNFYNKYSLQNVHELDLLMFVFQRGID